MVAVLQELCFIYMEKEQLKKKWLIFKEDFSI